MHAPDFALTWDQALAKVVADQTLQGAAGKAKTYQQTAVIRMTVVALSLVFDRDSDVEIALLEGWDLSANPRLAARAAAAKRIEPKELVNAC